MLVVLASKITGGDNVNYKNIIADCEGSLRRLGTEYLDVYMLHWPARDTPQSDPNPQPSLTPDPKPKPHPKPNPKPNPSP